MRILIAEDDAMSALMLQHTIRHLGHECVLAQNGLEAWALFQHMAVDVVISDWIMPDMDGIELCRRVRSDSRQGYTYFIFLTMLSDKADVLTGITAGADDYLTKPLDRSDLSMRLLVAERVTTLHQQLAAQTAKLEHLSQQLFQQAHVDALTQLGNRRRLTEDLAAIPGRVARYGQRYAAVMCDLDHFKAYNDHSGHIAGDTVLQLVARTITGYCRTEDFIYRYGGEEFLVIMPEQSLTSAATAAERLREAIEGLGISIPDGLITIRVHKSQYLGHLRSIEQSCGRMNAAQERYLANDVCN